MTVSHDTSDMVESFAKVYSDPDNSSKKFIFTLKTASKVYIKLYMYNKRMYPDACTNDGNQRILVTLYKGIVRVGQYM